jgi:hypothetical protein
MQLTLFLFIHHSLSTTSPKKKEQAKKVIHKPAPSAPVCSDTTDFQKSNTNTTITTNLKERIVRNGITRAPCVRMRSAMEAADLKLWCERPDHFAKLKQAFDPELSINTYS